MFQGRHEAQLGGDRWIKVGCFVIILGALLLIAARSKDAAIDKDSVITYLFVVAIKSCVSEQETLFFVYYH